jgi:hypothetical protein
MTSIILLLLLSSLRLVQEPPVIVRFDVGVPESEAKQLARELKKALDEAIGHYGTEPLNRVDLRLHATTVGFGNVSHAPWWRAAQMRKGVIHFQPVSTLAEKGIFLQVVRHEAAHLAMRNLRGDPIPSWLEEGEAMRFAAEPGARSPADLLPTLGDVTRGLTRPISREESRRAYLSAAAFVAYLGPWDEIDLEEDFDAQYQEFREHFITDSKEKKRQDRHGGTETRSGPNDYTWTKSGRTRWTFLCGLCASAATISFLSLCTLP